MSRSELRALAASVLCVGFQDAVPSERTESTLYDLQPGAIILFARHTASFVQTRFLTDRLRALLGERLPPVLAIDQEGGRVARLRDDVDEFPSMMALCATGDTGLARRAGERLGFDLRRAGFNLNFSPVLDLALDGQNTVIGSRAFSDDPRAVIEFGGAFATGLEAAGVVPTYKHFPGHGATPVDSHLALPSITQSERLWRERDLLPFAALLPHARAVMTAHIVVRALDPANPATTSSALLTGLLREELGFQGVCFTDCMHMNAIAQGIGTPQGAVLALVAGADCVAISQHLDVACLAVDRIVAAVEQRELPLERLQEAASRMHKLREELAAPLNLPARSVSVGAEVAKRAITLARGDSAWVPGPLRILSFQGSSTEGVQGTHAIHASLAEALRRRGIVATQESLPLTPSADDVASVVEDFRAARPSLVILMRRAHMYPEQAQAIRQLLGVCPSALLVSMREPFDVELFGEAVRVLCAYDDERVTIEALAEIIGSGERAPGELPVRWLAAR